MNAARAIIHVDMDAFFASVEERDHPELAGRPLIVAGQGPRSVVAAANYPARRFGLRSAMPTWQARKLCPQVIVRPPNMTRYRQVSSRIFSIFRHYTPLVEGLSLDEAFLDVTASRKVLGDMSRIGKQIKTEIHARTGLVASVGMANNKFLAKLASDADKPDGFCLVPDDIHAFLDPMPVECLWGVGQKTAARLKSYDILTIGRLRRCEHTRLAEILGSRSAGKLQALARGEDDRPVVATRREKSVSHETTFDTDIHDELEIRAVLQRLSEQVARRLRKKHYRARVIRVKLRISPFRTFSRQRRLPEPSHSGRLIYAVATELLQRWRRDYPGTGLRLLGVAATELRGSTDGPRSAAQKVESVMDEINDRFGERTLSSSLASLADRDI